jgi:hypothetical protein
MRRRSRNSFRAIARSQNHGKLDARDFDERERHFDRKRFKTDEHVLVEYNGTWCKATIHAIETDGKYKVKYSKGCFGEGVEEAHIAYPSSPARPNKRPKIVRQDSPVSVDSLIIEAETTPEALQAQLTPSVSPNTPIQIVSETKCDGVQNWGEIITRSKLSEQGIVCPPLQYSKQTYAADNLKFNVTTHKVQYLKWQIFRSLPHELDHKPTPYSKSREHHRIKRGADLMVICAGCVLLTQRPDIREFRILVYDDVIPLTTLQMLRYVTAEYPELLSRIHIVITHVSDTNDTTSPESKAQSDANARKIRNTLQRAGYAANVTVEAMLAEEYLSDPSNIIDAAYIDGVQVFANQRDVLTQVLARNQESRHNIPLIVAMTASMRGQVKGHRSILYAGIHQFYDHVTKTHHLQEFLPVRYCSREENCAGGCPMWTTFAVLQPVHAIDD